MKSGDFQILLTTNGSQTSRPALEHGVWLAGELQRPLVLLGVVEGRGQRGIVESLVAETAWAASEAGIVCETEVRRGRAEHVISEYTQGGSYLTVVGPLGRPAWRRWVRGRTFRELVARIPTPLLYIAKAHRSLERVLICMGGLGYASSVEHFSIYMARATGASLTLLHIVEPMTFDYPTAREVEDHWQEIAQTDTPQGRNLREALEEARGAGLKTELRVRHGNVIHEILEEIRTHPYDLVALGSPHSARSLRHLFIPNVTAEVGELVDLPILTVRYGYSLVYEGDEARDVRAAG